MILEELYRLLRSTHVQAQGIVDTLPEPLLVVDKDMVVLNANPAFLRTFDVRREETVGLGLFELGDGQWNIPELRKLLAEVVPKATAVLGYKVSHDFPGLGPRTMRVSARQLVHPDRNSTELMIVFEDVTTKEKEDVAKDLLVAETRHRLKNLMAMVQAVAHQTTTEGRTAEEYRQIFMGRFEAVLHAQEFIDEESADTDLSDVVRKCVAPLAGARAVIGPSAAVRLKRFHVMPLSMAFHELSTNALKYGALSSPDGRVHISWSTEPREGATHLSVDWREEGGPHVAAPTRRGFGTKLIEHNCRAEGGKAVFFFEPAGLRVQLSFIID